MLLVTQISNLLGVKREKEWSNKHKNTKHQLACIAASVISGGDFKGAIKAHCIDALKGTKYKGKVVLSGLPQKRKRGGNEEPAPEGAKNKQQTFNQYQQGSLCAILFLSSKGPVFEGMKKKWGWVPQHAHRLHVRQQVKSKTRGRPTQRDRKNERYAESWSGNKYLQKEAQLFFLTSTQISVQVSHKPEAETEEKDTGTENTQRRTRMILRSLFTAAI